ncbi:uncharacterized protein V1510DRAFT_410040 [Dipodascopsis tothii]|uniref:uncharacterized protein n=1 Tax=Dipodascopsis tothii TaxID=44089 RepID=UPI0034CEDA02
MMANRNLKGWLVARPVTIAEVLDGVDFVFHTNTQTCKQVDLDEDGHMNLSFQHSSTGEWVSITGKARMSNDPEIVNKYIKQDHLRQWLGNKLENSKNIGIVKFRTLAMAYAISEDFKFTPSTMKDGIMSGTVEHRSTAGTVGADQIKHFRKRVQHFQKLEEIAEAYRSRCRGSTRTSRCCLSHSSPRSGRRTGCR